MNPDNDWYGHKRILASYCGVKPKPIWGYLPHGWNFDLPQGVAVRRFKSAPYLAWNERHARQAADRGLQNIEVIGAPFIYLSELLSAGTIPGGAGTILFPAHSAESVETSNDHQSLISIAEEDFPPPYTVSVFYQDLNREGLEIYRRKKWRIVSFGSRNDSQFLFKQNVELVAHSHVVSDLPQTALWYGGLLSKQIAIIGNPPSHTRNISNNLPKLEKVDSLTRAAKTMHEYPQLWTGPIGASESHEIASIELGLRFKVPSTRLNVILGWASFRRSLAASTSARFVDLRYGKSARMGKPHHL